MRRHVIEKNRFRSEARAYKMHLGCSVTEDDSLHVIVSCVAINHYSQVSPERVVSWPSLARCPALLGKLPPTPRKG